MVRIFNELNESYESAGESIQIVDVCDVQWKKKKHFCLVIFRYLQWIQQLNYPVYHNGNENCEMCYFNAGGKKRLKYVLQRQNAWLTIWEHLI